MAYSIETREMVLSYLKRGHTMEEAHRELGVSVSAIKEWRKLLNETGSLQKRPLERTTRRFHDEQLKAYIDAHPDALLKEIAEEFGGSTSGADAALARLKITFKKRALFY